MPRPTRAQDHDAAEGHRGERDEVGDTESNGHALIDPQEFDTEAQHAGCDEVPSQDGRISDAVSAPLYQ